ncbi:MAG: nitroreductase family protein [Syntrophobacter sp.]
MEALQAILSRRSIRAYSKENVSEDILRQILEAAMSAPSAGNAQPWHFVVIRDRQILDAVPGFHPFSGMLRQAPLAILVCGDPTLEKYTGFWVQDCSAATQNILIAARALGLGAVWLGFYPKEDRIEGIRKILGIPDHIIPLAMVSIGWPAEEKPPAARYREDRVRRDRWE